MHLVHQEIIRAKSFLMRLRDGYTERDATFGSPWGGTSAEGENETNGPLLHAGVVPLGAP